MTQRFPPGEYENRTNMSMRILRKVLEWWNRMQSPRQFDSHIFPSEVHPQSGVVGTCVSWLSY